MGKNEKYKISLIIPVYNAERYIDRCLQSVIMQTHKNLEIILVNDGSTDGSLDLLNRYVSTDKRFILFNKENGGVSSARNYGIKEATGDYITFVDIDDSIQSTYCEQLLNDILINMADLSICGYNWIDNKYIMKVNKPIRLVFSKEEAVRNVLSDTYFSGMICGKLYKTDIIKSCQFNTKVFIWEDLLFFITYMVKCSNVSFANAKLYNYYQNSDSAIYTKDKVKYMSVLKSMSEIEKIVTNYFPNSKNELKAKYMLACLTAASSLSYKDRNELKEIRNAIKKNYSKKSIALLSFFSKVIVYCFLLGSDFYLLARCLKRKMVKNNDN